jgi:putative two-component system response regulator
MPHEKAVQIIAEGRGSHFDPDIADAFAALSERFREVAIRYADSDEDMAQKAAVLKTFTA